MDYVNRRDEVYYVATDNSMWESVEYNVDKDLAIVRLPSNNQAQFEALPICHRGSLSQSRLVNYLNYANEGLFIQQCAGIDSAADFSSDICMKAQDPAFKLNGGFVYEYDYSNRPRCLLGMIAFPQFLQWQLNMVTMSSAQEFIYEALKTLA